MYTLLSSTLDSVRSVSLEGPMSLLILVLGILMILGRWGIILMTLFTVTLGLIARNLIVMNMQTAQTVIGVPEVIYCLGGLSIGVSLLIRAIRFMLM